MQPLPTPALLTRSQAITFSSFLTVARAVPVPRASSIPAAPLVSGYDTIYPRTSSAWQRKRTVVIILVATIGGLIFLGIVIALLARFSQRRKNQHSFFSLRRKKTGRQGTGNRRGRRGRSGDVLLDDVSITRGFEHGIGRRVSMNYSELFEQVEARMRGGQAPPQAGDPVRPTTSRGSGPTYTMMDPESGAEADIDGDDDVELGPTQATIRAQQALQRALSGASTASSKKGNVLRKKSLNKKSPQVPQLQHSPIEDQLEFDPGLEYASQDIPGSSASYMPPFRAIYDIQDPRWRYPVYPIKEESILMEDEEEEALPRPLLSAIQDNSFGTTDSTGTDTDPVVTSTDVTPLTARPLTPLGLEFGIGPAAAALPQALSQDQITEPIKDSKRPYERLSDAESGTPNDLSDASIAGSSKSYLAVPKVPARSSLRSRSSGSTVASASSRSRSSNSRLSVPSSSRESLVRGASGGSSGDASFASSGAGSASNLSAYSPFIDTADVGDAYTTNAYQLAPHSYSSSDGEQQQTLRRAIPPRAKLQNFSRPTQSQSRRPPFPPLVLGPAKPQYQRRRSLTDPSPRGPHSPSNQSPSAPLARHGANRRRGSMSPSSPTASPVSPISSTSTARLSSLTPIASHSHPLSGPLPAPSAISPNMKTKRRSVSDSSNLRHELQRQQSPAQPQPAMNYHQYRTQGFTSYSSSDNEETPRPYRHLHNYQFSTGSASDPQSYSYSSEQGPLLASQDIADAIAPPPPSHPQSSQSQQRLSGPNRDAPPSQQLPTSSRPQMRRYSYIKTPPPRKPVPPPPKPPQPRKPLWTSDGYFDFLFSRSSTDLTARSGGGTSGSENEIMNRGRPRRPVRRSSDLESPIFWAQTPARHSPRRESG